MSEDSRPTASPYRYGVCLVGLEGPALESLRYLITHLNELQESLEFELVDVNEKDLLITELQRQKVVPATATLLNLIGTFAERQDRHNRVREYAYELLLDSPEGYVIVSLAQLSNGYYLWGKGRSTLLALGEWNKSFAPPSVVEAILTLVLRAAGGAAVPAADERTHLGTKGCLFDFNGQLVTTRYKVLNSFICSGCRRAIVDSGHETLAGDLRKLLGKTWLGQSTDPLAPAGICRKLGYDLYLTKGIRPTVREAAAMQLQGTWVGELLKVLGVVLAAALIVILGIKGSG